MRNGKAELFAGVARDAKVAQPCSDQAHDHSKTRRTQRAHAANPAPPAARTRTECFDGAVLRVERVRNSLYPCPVQREAPVGNTNPGHGARLDHAHARVEPTGLPYPVEPPASQGQWGRLLAASHGRDPHWKALYRRGAVSGADPVTLRTVT